MKKAILKESGGSIRY